MAALTEGVIMDEISGVDQIGIKNPIGRVSSKPHVSQTVTESVQAAEKAKELEKLEFQREEIDRAFALITEIRHKIEAAYKELSPPEEG